MICQHLRVGVCAVLDSTVTPHARTFLRALAVARNHLPALGPLEFILLDDEADGRRADTLARYLVSHDVAIVIGHFSSDAAICAAKHYASADIALITPAATIDALTHSQSNVFRLCPPDRELATRLTLLALDNGWQRLAINADDSHHGLALTVAIKRAALAAGLDASATATNADAVVFAGRLAASRSFWERHRDAGLGKPLVLTDDAASHQLGVVPQPGEPPLYVIGFKASQLIPAARPANHLYRQQFGGEPETYFAESLAAFEILAALVDWVPLVSGPRNVNAALLQALKEQTFNTSLGQVRFDHGECLGVSHSVWRIDPSGWQLQSIGSVRAIQDT